MASGEDEVGCDKLTTLARVSARRNVHASKLPNEFANKASQIGLTGPTGKKLRWNPRVDTCPFTLERDPLTRGQTVEAWVGGQYEKKGVSKPGDKKPVICKVCVDWFNDEHKRNPKKKHTRCQGCYYTRLGFMRKAVEKPSKSCTAADKTPRVNQSPLQQPNLVSPQERNGWNSTQSQLMSSNNFVGFRRSVAVPLKLPSKPPQTQQPSDKPALVQPASLSTHEQSHASDNDAASDDDSKTSDMTKWVRDHNMENFEQAFSEFEKHTEQPTKPGVLSDESAEAEMGQSTKANDDLTDAEQKFMLDFVNGVGNSIFQ